MAREIVTSENKTEYDKKKLGIKDPYKSLQEENKSTFPKIPVNKVFKNERAEVPKEKNQSYEKAMEEKKELKDREIDSKHIVPTQKNVNFNNLKDVKKAKNIKDHITAIEHEGKFYLMDGHHRVANHILSGGGKIKIKVH